ncbi:ADP-ribosylation factor GTPase-activating protein 2-like [Oscarella lobularis]|uniref:ADP-ribosylation factor GTPase-activating protein 2-like n=1 Tax=Oscarella lobularis TaxID=121494 RepID=UPI003313E718
MATVSKQQVSDVFRRLRAIPTNKACFDCHASDPSWASISYGVFLCMQCSGIHRSLGVHLSFIRSTQLDSWTWIQLRAMQVGGNAQATAFFRQHGCTSTNHSIKYNSRAAALYKEKIAGMAERAHQKYGTDRLHISVTSDEFGGESQEDDFFDQFQPQSPINSTPSKKPLGGQDDETNDAVGPQVSLLASTEPGASLSKLGGKSSIGQRIPAASKKKGIGAKKGLGAQKVATNFKEAEEKASAAEKRFEREKKEEERLTTSLAVETKKREQIARNVDPRKADQLDRLGMGASGMRTVSHSASAAMNTIDQVAPVRESKASKSFGMTSSSGRRGGGDDGGFFDSFGLTEPRTYIDEPSRYGQDFDDGWGLSKFESSSTSGGRQFGGSKSSARESTAKTNKSHTKSAKAETSAATDRFSSSKGISSDQYFGKETGSSTEYGRGGGRLDQFSGASGISSADVFGENEDRGEGRFDLRSEVSRVTGKLSTMASGVIGSIKDRYGRH